MSRYNFKSRTLAVNERVLKGKELLRKTPDGQFGQLVPPSKEAVRAAIEAQLCPFCARGPYKSLAVHTCKAHGVNSRELRQMAGMTTLEPTCAPEYSERQREVMKATPERTARMNQANREAPPDRAKWTWTEAGRKKVSDNLKAFNATEQGSSMRSVAGRLGVEARKRKLAEQRVHFTCPRCKQDFSLRPCDVKKRGRNPHCSRACQVAKKECVRGHEFTEENTRFRRTVRGGVKRSCRQCDRDHATGRIRTQQGGAR